ncbi:hypothetical protein Hamer_G028957, partial [Homarus americanus]
MVSLDWRPGWNNDDKIPAGHLCVRNASCGRCWQRHYAILFVGFLCVKHARNKPGKHSYRHSTGFPAF